MDFDFFTLSDYSTTTAEPDKSNLVINEAIAVILWIAYFCLCCFTTCIALAEDNCLQKIKDIFGLLMDMIAQTLVLADSLYSTLVVSEVEKFWEVLNLSFRQATWWAMATCIVAMVYLLCKIAYEMYGANKNEKEKGPKASVKISQSAVAFIDEFFDLLIVICFLNKVTFVTHNKWLVRIATGIGFINQFITWVSRLGTWLSTSCCCKNNEDCKALNGCFTFTCSISLEFISVLFQLIIGFYVGSTEILKRNKSLSIGILFCVSILSCCICCVIIIFYLYSKDASEYRGCNEFCIKINGVSTTNYKRHIKLSSYDIEIGTINI